MQGRRQLFATTWTHGGSKGGGWGHAVCGGGCGWVCELGGGVRGWERGWLKVGEWVVTRRKEKKSP